MKTEKARKSKTPENPEKRTHIKSWKDFSTAVEETFHKEINWIDFKTSPPIIPLHLKSENLLPIEFAKGYELFGRGVVVSVKETIPYRYHYMVMVQMYPDCCYCMPVSKPRDNFGYKNINQKKGKKSNHTTIICVHVNGYTFLRATKKQIKTLEEKLQKIRLKFPPIVSSESKTVIEG